jgi:DNA-binding transcriptional LysR family regulator
MDFMKLRIETDIFLSRLGIRNQAIFESDQLSVVVRATLDGAGIAFLPKLYIRRELDKGALIALNSDSVLWHHKIVVLSRNTKNVDPILARIRDHFLKVDTLEVLEKAKAG